jgi:hypothetical protein
MNWHLLFLQLKMVDLQSSEADLAKLALFTKHPEMEGKFILLIMLYAEMLSTICYLNNHMLLFDRLAKESSFQNLQIGNRKHILD